MSRVFMETGERVLITLLRVHSTNTGAARLEIYSPGYQLPEPDEAPLLTGVMSFPTPDTWDWRQDKNNHRTLPYVIDKGDGLKTVLNEMESLMRKYHRRHNPRRRAKELRYD